MVGAEPRSRSSFAGALRSTDGRPCALQGFHDPPVVGERRRFTSFGLPQSLSPDIAAFRREVAEPVVNSGESAVQDGVADGQAPQRAGFAGLWIGMGELTERHGGLDQTCRVIQVGQRHRGGPHQRPVSRGLAGALMQRPAAACRSAALGARRRVVAPRALPSRAPGGSECRRPSPSSAHCAHRAAMRSCAASDRRSSPSAVTSAMATAIDVSSVHSPGAQPKDPPPSMTTSALPQGWPELVSRAQRIAAGHSEKDTGGPVGLCGRQLGSQGHNARFSPGVDDIEYVIERTPVAIADSTSGQASAFSSLSRQNRHSRNADSEIAEAGQSSAIRSWTGDPALGPLHAEVVAS